MSLDRPRLCSDPVSWHTIEDQGLATFAPEDLRIQRALTEQVVLPAHLGAG
jgi:hypothetical protein